MTIYGWVVDVSASAKEILEKIQEIRNNPNEYQRIKKNFAEYQFKTVEEMQNEYLKIYMEVQLAIKNEVVFTKLMDELQQKTDVYDLRVLRINLTAERDELQDYKNRYDFLVKRFQKKQNTKLWQTAKKIKGFFINKGKSF